MLNTLPLKKETNFVKQQNIINNNLLNSWSHDERSNLIQKKGNDNIIMAFHNKVNNNGLIHDAVRPLVPKVVGTVINDNNYMISYSKKLKKFTIYDNNKKEMGYFTVEHIIKYLANIYDDERQFMTDINLQTFANAKELIKIFVFKIDYNKKNKKCDVLIHDYSQSGFMGDVSLLFELNNLLFLYQEHNMYNDLASVNDSSKIKIEQNIKKCIYLLLNYTIKLIFIISEKIKYSKDCDELKNILLKYAIACSHRINLFVQEQLSVLYVCDKEIKKAYLVNMEIKNVIKKKLEVLTKEIIEDVKSDRVVYNGGDALAL